jgi:hypothetical protein
VTVEEYDRIHRFLRLWRKPGGTMVEVDTALRVLGVPTLQPASVYLPTSAPTSGPAPTAPVNTGADDVDWIDFAPSCRDGKCGQQGCRSCSAPGNKPAGGYTGHHHHHHDKDKKSKPKPPVIPCISPDFLHKLVALKKLADLTSLEILNLLAFWGTITTVGTPSLYSQLFLTHNLLGIDTVLRWQSQGDFTSSPSRLTPACSLQSHNS